MRVEWQEISEASSEMKTTINYSTLMGAIACASAASDYEWAELIRQAMREVKNADDNRLEIFQNLGDTLYKEVESCNVVVSDAIEEEEKYQAAHETPDVYKVVADVLSGIRTKAELQQCGCRQCEEAFRILENMERGRLR